MEGGRIAESGSYRELVAREGSRFRALMAAQLTAVDQNMDGPRKEAEAEVGGVH